MGRIEQKKADKRKRLLESAYVCFAEKGVSDTSIAEICSRSHIAKGTFYLYYNNKDELSDALSRELSDKLCMEAFAYTAEHHEADLCSNVKTLIHYLVSSFEKHPDLLKILHNHFIFPMSADEFVKSDKEPAASFRADMERCSSVSGVSVREQFNILASLCMMSVELCYSSRMYNLPDSSDSIDKAMTRIITDCFPAD